MRGFYRDYLSSLKLSSKYRELNLVNQDVVLDFSTNDYLGLSKDPRIIESSYLAAKKYGVGSTGSRLLSGNNDLYVEFEKRIAQDKHTEKAVIFNSGFQANISSLACLLDAKVLKVTPLVFFDRLNHASLYQAVSLSKANLIRYHHNNMDHLKSLLEKYADSLQPKFIVSETIFGMDGDIAPLDNLVYLAKKYNSFLYLDEAHATGVLGDTGYGLGTDLDLSPMQYLVMGTFSKALGASGGYIASSKVICDYIVNTAQGFIYSTALSPNVIGAALEAWKLIPTFHEVRKEIMSNSALLREKLAAFGIAAGDSTKHIVPIIIGAEKRTLEIQNALLNYGILVSCVRPPTVPPGSSRLRIAITAKHSASDIDKLVEALREVLVK